MLNIAGVKSKLTGGKLKRENVEEGTRGEVDVMLKYWKKDGTYIVYILTNEAVTSFKKFKTQPLSYMNKKVPATGGTKKTYKKMMDFIRKNNLSAEFVTMG